MPRMATPSRFAGGVPRCGKAARIGVPVTRDRGPDSGPVLSRHAAMVAAAMCSAPRSRPRADRRRRLSAGCARRRRPVRGTHRRFLRAQRGRRSPRMGMRSGARGERAAAQAAPAVTASRVSVSRWSIVRRTAPECVAMRSWTEHTLGCRDHEHRAQRESWLHAPGLGSSMSPVPIGRVESFLDVPVGVAAW